MRNLIQEQGICCNKENIENVFLIIIKWREVCMLEYKTLHCDLYSSVFEVIHSKTHFLIFLPKDSYCILWNVLIIDGMLEKMKLVKMYWNILLLEISLSFFDWSSKLAVGNYHNRQSCSPFIIPLLSLFIFSGDVVFVSTSITSYIYVYNV